jgi:hypothetical protein
MVLGLAHTQPDRPRTRPAAGSPSRRHLQRELDAHVRRLGYSNIWAEPDSALQPEITRMNPLRRRIAYGETVVRADLASKECHRRLLAFSQRRTRRRSTILFFIGVASEHREALESLLIALDIRDGDGIRGGHVHVVPIDRPPSRGA